MLLGAPGIATRSKDATRGSWPSRSKDATRYYPSICCNQPSEALPLAADWQAGQSYPDGGHE